MAINDIQIKKLFLHLDAGYTIAASAKKAGMSPASAYRVLKAHREGKPFNARIIRPVQSVANEMPGTGYLDRKRQFSEPGPIPYDKLSDEAKRAWNDFEYFRLRYMGHVSTPWQVEAANQVVELLLSPNKEYVVINCPPGVGKTTLLHDIVCWLIVRNRAVRLLLGSATMQQAMKSANRVRRTLERSTPVTASDDDRERGLAVDAETTLAADFGRFKPVDREQWTREAFIVAQYDDAGGITEKESTVQAYGMDANYLGDRVDGCFWDDLVDPDTTRSQDLRERLEERWGDVAESRLEPAGLMVLMGQRLAADDLYRYCLDMLQPLDLEDEDLMDEMSEEEIESLQRHKKYQSIIYKAHYPDNCFPGSHKKSAEPYPQGCLLDPRRLPWREISGLMASRENRFRVVYQQEDVSPDEVFVPNNWIYGDPSHRGCIDKDRDAWQLPPGLDITECTVIATADPSPTNWWAVELWIYSPKFNERFLIALHRAKMEAPDFLDFNLGTQQFTGIMNEWQEASRTGGFPIEYWIWEQNAAQRFFLQYDLVKRWASVNGVQILGHNTARNKADDDLGVSSIREHYQYGRVRLPGKGDGKLQALRLIEEVTKYGHFRTNDTVMAHWFFEWNLPYLHRTRRTVQRQSRPTWLQKPERRTLARTG